MTPARHEATQRANPATSVRDLLETRATCHAGCFRSAQFEQLFRVLPFVHVRTSLPLRASLPGWLLPQARARRGGTQRASPDGMLHASPELRFWISDQARGKVETKQPRSLPKGCHPLDSQILKIK